MCSSNGEPTNGFPGSDVVRPYLNGKDLNTAPRHQWTIDFGTDRTLESAALYESAFEHLVAHVKPVREKNNREVLPPESGGFMPNQHPAMRSGDVYTAQPLSWHSAWWPSIVCSCGYQLFA